MIDRIALIVDLNAFLQPAARDGKDLSRTVAYLSQRARHSPSMCTTLLTQGVPWQEISSRYEIQMGFPSQWSAAVYTV